MGSALKIALPLAAGAALPLMFPAAAGAAGAGAAAGGAGLAGTGLAGGAAIPLSGIGPGGIGMASFGGAAPSAGMLIPGLSPGVFPTSPGEAFGASYGPSGHGATIFNTNLAQPASPWSRFRDAFGEVDWSKYGDAFSGGANREPDQQQLLPPPMAPPIMGGNLEHGGTSFAGAMSRPISPELGPSYLPPVDPWSIPDVTTAVPEDRYMGMGTPLSDPLAGYTPTPMDLTGYLRWLQQQQPQY